MNKTKFLEGLKEALQGELSAAEINTQLLYYERYIDDELRKGRTEKDILEELGSPRLIARTIIETKGNNGSYSNTYYEDREVKENQGSSNERKFKIQLNGAFGIIAGLVIIILVISLIFSLVSALAPILIPLLIIAFVISYFSKKS
jgi:uncharacterized membrane protein